MAGIKHWIGLAAVLASVAMPAGAVSSGHRISWGKAGVSLDRYMADARECGHRAAATDLSGSDPARALVIASRMIDNAADEVAAQQAVRMAAPERQIAKAGRILADELAVCLTARGYSRFKLTREQYKQLNAMALGSMERRAYLHALASDAQVLDRQRVTKA